MKINLWKEKYYTMAFRYDTRHLPKTTQAIIRNRDEAEELRKKEQEQVQNIEIKATSTEN